MKITRKKRILNQRKERFLLEDRKCDSEIRKGLQRNTRDVREDEKEIDSQSKRPRR